MGTKIIEIGTYNAEIHLRQNDSSKKNNFVPRLIT
jgi:hypothetical protein